MPPLYWDAPKLLQGANRTPRPATDRQEPPRNSGPIRDPVVRSDRSDCPPIRILMPLRILIIESDETDRDAIQLALSTGAHEVVCVGDAKAARVRMEGAGFDLIFCDIDVLIEAGDAGLLRSLIRAAPRSTVIATSESENSERIEMAMREGAYDLLRKPVIPSEVNWALRRAAERQNYRIETRLLQREIDEAAGNRPIIAASPGMIDLLELAENSAAFATPILFCGERGTWRESIARVVHAQSPRRDRPFVALHCEHGKESEIGKALFGASPSPTLRESKPAPGLIFAAHGGTLYLDEVSALSPALQRELLRAMTEEAARPIGGAKARAINVRIVASTSKDLRASVDRGDFSEELEHRLGSAVIMVPALRDRKEDIPLLVDYLFSRACQKLGKTMIGVDADAIESLVLYSWPGNIRELQNVVERATLAAEGDKVRRLDLPREVLPPSSLEPNPRRADFGLKRERKRMEADLIRRALRETGGNRTHAARLLEISHRALLYKIKEYRTAD